MLENVIRLIPAFTSAGSCPEAGRQRRPTLKPTETTESPESAEAFGKLFTLQCSWLVCVSVTSLQQSAVYVRQSVQSWITVSEVAESDHFVLKKQLSKVWIKSVLWNCGHFFCFCLFFFKPQQCFVHRFVNILHIFKTQDSSVSNHIFLSLFICFASLPGSWTSEKLFIRSQNYFHPQDNVKRIVFICKIYVFFLSMGNVF